MEKKDLWIRNATLVTMDSRNRVIHGNLLIRGGVVETISKRPPPRSARNVIDSSGKVILPGFIQCHLHLCQTLYRNLADDMELLDWLSERIWPMEASHTPETIRVSAFAGVHELLSSGTTCILDMATVRHTESLIQAVQETGLRANIGKCLMDHPKTTPEDLREPTRDAILEAKMLYEKWNGASDDRIRVSYAPRFVVSCTEKLLQEVAKLSKEQNAIVHTHASENLKEISVVKELTNFENIECLDQLGLTNDRLVLAHCIWLKPNEMEILKKSKTNVVHCPSSNLKLASGIARVPEMLKKKINVTLGADGAPCNNSLNIFQEMRLAALLHKPGNGPKSMPAIQVLEMATKNGAKALHWDDKIGSIEEGKRADLVSLDLGRIENFSPSYRFDAIASSIVYSGNPSHVEWTMVDGKVLYDSKNGIRARWASNLPQQIRSAQTTLAQRAKKRR